MRPTYRHALDPNPRYVFIDGNSFVLEWRNMIEAVHGVGGTINFAAMRLELGAQRLHWYDAVLDVNSVRGVDSVAESEREMAELRAADRRRFLESVQEADGYMVRMGTSRGVVEKGRIRPREKEVDVLLAVDSLLHAANGNMKHAVIIGGDLDHRPVVEALMQLGVFVTVYGHARVSSEFRLAADSFRTLNYDVLYEWTDFEWQQKNPKVTDVGRMSGGAARELDRGAVLGREVVLELINGHAYQAYRTDELRPTYWCEDGATLLRYLDRHMGKVAWKNGGRLG